MKKKVMAVAVAGALAAPGLALAQASTVQIYGNVIMNYNYLDQGAGTVKADFFNAHDSNIGFRGEEKLGGGLSAWFQCESSFDPGGTGGGESLCARNSGVGIKGAFGNIFAGNWDTAMKLTHGPARPFSTSGVFGMGSLLWNESGSNVGNGAGNAAFIAGVTNNGQVNPVPNANGGSFTRRQANLWSWHSPSWNGFQAMLSFSAAEEAVEGAGGRTLLTSGTMNAKPRLWSFGASYSSGPLYLGAGYERHKDYNPGATVTYTGGRDRAWLLAGAYTFGPVKFMAIYSDLDYTTGPGQSLDLKAFGLYADWKIQGPHGLRLGYTNADDAKGTAGGPNVTSLAAPTAAGQTDSGAELYAIQYYYSFSKRTEVNFGYAKLDNDVRSRHRLQTAGSRNTCQGAPANCNRDQDSFTIGIRHRF